MQRVYLGKLKANGEVITVFTLFKRLPNFVSNAYLGVLLTFYKEQSTVLIINLLQKGIMYDYLQVWKLYILFYISFC
jgi:hypothetical protein